VLAFFQQYEKENVITLLQNLPDGMLFSYKIDLFFTVLTSKGVSFCQEVIKVPI
jgi:hypothetical protein